MWYEAARIAGLLRPKRRGGIARPPVAPDSPRGISVSAVSPGPVDTGFFGDEIEKVADVVFSQPMSSAEQIAAAVLRAVESRSAEIDVPALSGKLATLGYLSPRLFTRLRPLLEKLGADAIVSLPPAGVTDEKALLAYYQQVGGLTALPLFAQSSHAIVVAPIGVEEWRPPSAPSSSCAAKRTATRV